MTWALEKIGRDRRHQVCREAVNQGFKLSGLAVVEAVKSMNIQIDTPRDVADWLAEDGVDLETIDSIVLSHWHFDHVGDPTRFPPSTGLVVGPDFKQNCLPGYPTNAESMIPDEAFRGRKVNEVDFTGSTLRIADLEAMDWFGEGSFYLLSTPGHAVGHLSALARTTADNGGGDCSFILLAGDVCHHAGELRPTDLEPLPSEIPADAKHTYKSRSAYCELHPYQCVSRPFYCPSAGEFNMDAEMMKETIQKVAKLDTDPNVFVVLAHDHWLLDVVDLFPQAANDWKEKGWKEKAKWRFLLDFE